MNYKKLHQFSFGEYIDSEINFLLDNICIVKICFELLLVHAFIDTQYIRCGYHKV